jgi:type VI secretion system FHA domain protein
MLLALSVISAHGASLGPTAYKIFDERGGTIGRVEGNDWVLPDPQNFVSSRHARVRSANGVFYIEDTSSNGTFINAPDRPVSRTEPVALRDGDRLYIGDYEIIVQIIPGAPGAASAPAAAAVPPPPAAAYPPGMPAGYPPAPGAPPGYPPAAPGLGLGTVDPLAALGGARSEPRMPPAHAPSAPNGVPAGQTPVPPTAQSYAPTVVTHGPQAAAGAGAPASPASPVSGAAAPPAASSGMQGGAAEVLAALGLDPARVDPAIYQQLGVILRLTVQGLVEVLKSRAEVKNSFRMPTTSIKPVENNPLKFSMNAEDAVYNLFVKRNPGYLGPVEAFEEGFQDVTFHQLAVLAGIRAAFNAMLAKFHPTQLEEMYERKLRRTAMLGLGSKLKYWEMYRAQFEEIDRDREAHFQLLFGEAFARAYNEHLQKLAAEARLRKR